MGKGDRTTSKPSSSARAAEVLASKGAGGFGFGGYSGSTLVGPNVAGFGFGAAAVERLAPAAGAAEPSSGGGNVPLTVQVDGELAQCLRHLTKKDPITKTKALQNFRALIPSRSTADLLTAMPPWIYTYNRLILDASRAVRSETAATLACVLTALGKAVAPHLKVLIGPWFLAMYDTYGDAAEASRAAFAAAFPVPRRQLEVVLYCRTELMSYVKDQLAATPQQLGDPKKDSPEELEERHERVQAACLAALAALITMMAVQGAGMGGPGTAPEAGAAAGEAAGAAGAGGSSAAAAAPGGGTGREEVLAAVREVLCKPGFWKVTIGAKSAAVRRAAYGLARTAAQQHQQGAGGRLLEGCAAESAVCVLGALGEKEPGNHGAMWEAVLTYAKFFPDGWRHVALRKMLLPRLTSLLRHGCYGSAPLSLPALLPLLPLLPPGTLGPRPDVLVSLLEAVWAGMQDPACANRAAKSASLSAYRECLAWGLTQSARLTARADAASAAAPAEDKAATGAAAGYCEVLLQGTLVQHVLPAALGSSAHAEGAREVVGELAQTLAQVGGPTPVGCLTEVLCTFVRGALESRVAAAAAAAGGASQTEGELAAACEGAAALLARVRSAVAEGSEPGQGLAARVAAAAAQGLMAAGPSGLPPAASQLLASLLREYGSTAVAGSRLEPGQEGSGDGAAAAEGASSGCGARTGVSTGSGSFNLDSLVTALKNGPALGPPVEATADLLVALCTAHHDPPAIWERVLAALLQPSQPPQPPTDQDQAREGELQRVLLLLQRCAAATANEARVAAGAGGRGGALAQTRAPAADTAPASAASIGWTSASLDALAVRLARGGGAGSAAATAAGGDGAAAVAAALLSTALGSNAAGQVLLSHNAVREVMVALTGHVERAVAAGAVAAARAACFAVDALGGALRNRCGLWGFLPDAVCDAVAALAVLGWRVPYGSGSDRSMSHYDAVRARHPDTDEESNSGSGEEDEYCSEECDSASDAGTASEGEEAAVDDGGLEPAAELRSARVAAARWWRESRPLTVAAAALPPGWAGALPPRLAGLLAADAAAARLPPRAWAVHAAELLAAAPGGATQRQALLEVLLQARSEWRSWSSVASGGAGAGSSSSAAVAAAAGGSTSAGGGGVAPSLEYLARLAEAAGPGTLLGTAYLDVEEAEEEEGKDMVPSFAAGGRCWVLMELLCSVHWRQQQQDGSLGGCGAEEEERGLAPGESSASRRAVGRAAEALLAYAVYGAVAEVEAGEDGAGAACGGVYGGLLRSLVDDLAEGCRDSGGTAEAHEAATSQAPESGELPPTQAAFLDALCHVAATIERASSQAARASSFHYTSSSGGDGGDASPQPPLLPHQLRLCRHWLSTCRPENGGARTTTGLPPQAVLRLLPLTAGPVRRAAAAAAATAASGGGSRGSGGSTAAAAAEDLLALSGLPELSCAWVRHCLGRPAVLLEPTARAVAALEVAVACFPTPDARGGGSSAAGSGARAAAAAALARSGGAGLAAAERPLLKQLVQHQLVRHAGMAAARRQQQADATGAPASQSDAASSASTSASTSASGAVRSLVLRLAHAAVVYDWRSLGQPEWHALLQAVQDHMSGAVSAVSGLLADLAAAARSAADGVLQQAPGTTPPGPLALQLLRKLSARGVLDRVAQGAELQAAAKAALGGCWVGVAAREAAVLAAVLTELQEELAADAGGGTSAGVAAASREYGNTIAACCTAAMQLAIALGGVETYGAAFGPGASAAVTGWLALHRDFWAAVTRCAGRALAPGREHLGAQAGAAAVAAQAAALEAVGLDAVGALLAVALTPAPTHGSGAALLQPVAFRLLLGDTLLPRLTLAETAAAPSAPNGDGGGTADVELPEYGGDDVAFLMAGGVRPEMAPWLLPAAARPAAGASTGASASGGSVRVYVTAWALLLAHALYLDPASRGLAVLRAVLREVEPLVSALLDQLVPELGLQRQQGQGQAQAAKKHHHHRHQHHHHRHHHHQARSGGAAAAVADVDVGRWRLAEALREVGLPLGHHALRATCRSLYRAVLRALPATARGWFGDLRDRGLAAAVESYTAVLEGPALLAAEIASVQSLRRSDERFTIRASAGSREVVAALEVEDGAVLELAVKLPGCMPLRAPEVECRRKVGVNDTRLRKWLLSISTFLRHQNGSVADAISLWKRNVDSEFAGVEACLICYSVISSVNGQLPRLVCRTCNVRFHPACLYKWFKSAGKSQCPHCQALW